MLIKKTNIAAFWRNAQVISLCNPVKAFWCKPAGILFNRPVRANGSKSETFGHKLWAELEEFHYIGFARLLHAQPLTGFIQFAFAYEKHNLPYVVPQGHSGEAILLSGNDQVQQRSLFPNL